MIQPNSLSVVGHIFIYIYTERERERERGSERRGGLDYKCVIVSIRDKCILIY